MPSTTGNRLDLEAGKTYDGGFHSVELGTLLIERVEITPQLVQSGETLSKKLRVDLQSFNPIAQVLETGKI